MYNWVIQGESPTIPATCASTWDPKKMDQYSTDWSCRATVQYMSIDMYIDMYVYVYMI